MTVCAETEIGSHRRCGGDTSSLLAAFESVATQVAMLAPPEALRLVRNFRHRLDAIEATAIAASMQSDDDHAGAQVAAGDRRVSRRERRKRAQRGAAVRQRRDLADRMADGSLSGEHVDLLAGASDKSDGAALNDDDLVDAIAASSVDQSRKLIDAWLAERRSEADVKADEQRLQRARCVRKYTSADGMHWVAAGVTPHR